MSAESNNPKVPKIKSWCLNSQSKFLACFRDNNNGTDVQMIMDLAVRCGLIMMATLDRLVL